MWKVQFSGLHLPLKIRLLVLYIPQVSWEAGLTKGKELRQAHQSRFHQIVDFELVKTGFMLFTTATAYDRTKTSWNTFDALEINGWRSRSTEGQTSPVSTCSGSLQRKLEYELCACSKQVPAYGIKPGGRYPGMSADERERLLAEDREKTRRDNAAYYETGLVEGRAEGREAGIVEGREAGLAEGRAEGCASIISHMLAQGLSPEQISSFTGVTLNEVNALTAEKLKYE